MADLSVEAPPMSRKQIREFTRQIRKALGIDQVVYIDVVSLLEFVLPNALPGFVLDIRDHSSMGGDHGQANPDQNMIVLREDVYEGALDGLGRDRGTVLHELGHVLLHKTERMTHRRAAGPPKTYRDPEWQAKAFSGEFLVPAHLIGGFTKIKEVADACGVSVDSAKFQLKTYLREGIIKKGQIEDLAL